MGAVTSIVGTRTALTTTALNSLAAGAYVSAGVINHTDNDPLDVLLEVQATPGTVSGNRQLVIFAQGSLDGTSFETGPTSGTTTTDEPNLRFIGVLPLTSNATLQMDLFSLAAAYGGVLPAQTRIVIKNESGAALAASGHGVWFSEVIGNVV
ncbi:hypothetical protein ACFOON_15110 [Novosphingobium piscinae]|uniref:Uncharacterized protein n=1 Tax=Novosphingobium piscinae TaxID=1507448 RepID=A0A7X1FXF5_9SPHN|nr:hypothetical protein [Novosphingobium piscinae]MBC2668770.1 hypothetical protein [Novosphingobium piscinae]